MKPWIEISNERFITEELKDLKYIVDTNLYTLKDRIEVGVKFICSDLLYWDWLMARTFIVRLKYFLAPLDIADSKLIKVYDAITAVAEKTENWTGADKLKVSECEYMTISNICRDILDNKSLVKYIQDMFMEEE